MAPSTSTPSRSDRTGRTAVTGGRRGVVEAAIARLDEEFGLFDASPIVLNPAHRRRRAGFRQCGRVVETNLEPPGMLARIKRIERDFGRRSGKHWAARVLDLDIALWSGGRFRSRGLTIPHNGLEKRAFVIRPLAAIAPDWRVRGPLTAQHLAYRLARRAPLGSLAKGRRSCAPSRI